VVKKGLRGFAEWSRPIVSGAFLVKLGFERTVI